MRRYCLYGTVGALVRIRTCYDKRRFILSHRCPVVADCAFARISTVDTQLEALAVAFGAARTFTCTSFSMLKLILIGF